MTTATNSVFSKSTTLISIGLAILGLIGIYLTPANTNFIIFGISAVIIFVLIYIKVSQIDEQAEDIQELYKRLDVESRFSILEKELAEQRGRLNALGGKR